MTNIPSRDGQSKDDREGISFAKLASIFEQIAEAPQERQDAMLDELCPDADVRQQVLALLEADSTKDPLLDHSLVPAPVNVRVGESIAEYKLLQELGQGGMGVVFLAEQLEPVRRTVALKVIKPGVDTREVIARFEAERQALSLMDHPNIAKVLDAGTTEAGRPYFVMELVQGRPVTDYCNEKKLSINERLQLFLSVCRAIQHAHQKGIIHRDIKPSNVLVTEYDGQPVAKVIDFGVAKAINQSLTDMTVFTGIGQIIGTYEYMSPEQSRVNQVDVDTRSDIYSLGVLLYELLTGRPPFKKARLRSVPWEEMLRIIREEDPPKPSSRITDTITQLSTQTSPDKDHRQRANGSAKPSRIIPGELDWIVMKAMEKDRNRRYGTPNGLANDIDCFLCGDAVTACPPSAFYSFTKFAKRNKVILATGAVVATTLVLGMVGTSWQAVRALRAEKAAETSAAEAQTVNAFLEDDLLGLAGAESQLSAGLRPDPNLKLVTLLDRALNQVDERFADQPQLKARLKATLANSFKSIGRDDVASPLYEEWLDYLRANQGKKHPDTIVVMRKLVRSYIDQSRLADAETLCQAALTSSREVLGGEHDVTLELLNDLGILYQKQKRFLKAERAHKECLDIKRRLLGDGHPDTLSIMSNLALLSERLNRFDDAEKLHTRVLEVHRQIIPTDHLRYAAALNSLGRCYLKRGRNRNDSAHLEMAEPLLVEGREIYLRQRGPDHPDTLEIHRNLAQVYSEQRRHDLAEPILSDLVDRLKRLRGPKHATTLDAMNLLGWTYMHQARLAEAENTLAEAFENGRQIDPRTPRTLQVMGNLAIVYHRMAKLEQSIALDERVLDLSTEVLGPNHAETLSSMARLGLSCLETGRTEDGEALLERAFDAGPKLPGAFKIGAALATSYKRKGDLENARVWTDRQVQNAQENLSSDSLELASVLAGGGARLLRIKAWMQAEAILRECHSIRVAQAPNSWVAFHTQSMLGEAISEQERYQEAEPYLVEAYQGMRDWNQRPGVMPDRFHLKLVKSIDRIIRLYQLMENSPEADRWKKEKAGFLAASARAL